MNQRLPFLFLFPVEAATWAVFWSRFIFVTSVSIYASPWTAPPFMYFAFLRAMRLYLLRYHLGSHLSGSGVPAARLAYSSPLGSLLFLFLFLGMKISAPPTVSSTFSSFTFLYFFASGSPSLKRFSMRIFLAVISSISSSSIRLDVSTEISGGGKSL